MIVEYKDFKPKKCIAPLGMFYLEIARQGSYIFIQAALAHALNSSKLLIWGPITIEKTLTSSRLA